MRIIRYFYIVLFLLMPLYNTMAQEIRIIDSVIVRKECQETLSLDVEFSFPKVNQKPLLLRRIHNYVVSDPVVVRSIMQDGAKYNVGLIYVVETLEGQIVPLSSYPGYPGYCPVLSDSGFMLSKNNCFEKRCSFSEGNMKLQYKDVPCDSLHYYDDESLLLYHADTVVHLFPVLSEKILQPGRYKFYFYYCYNAIDDTLFDSFNGQQIHIIQGEIISNKVDLIVEGYPGKWWKKWKRKAK